MFAWLVTPLKLYAKHEAAFREDSLNSSAGSKQALAVQKLAEDPQNRLIIYCKFHDQIVIDSWMMTDSAYSSWSKFGPIAVCCA